MDVTVTDAAGRIVKQWQKEKQGDFVLTSPAVGEVSVCFANGLASFAAKTIEFEVLLTDKTPEGEVKNPLDKTEAAVSPLQQSVSRLQEELHDIVRTLKYIKARELRNLQTVHGTELRIFYFSLFDVLLIVGMSVMQVYVLRTFFTTKGKIRV